MARGNRGNTAVTFPFRHPIAVMLLFAALAPAGGPAGAQSNSQSCAAGGKPMVVGYFDHTAAWYRRQTKLKPNQIAPLAWQPPPQGGIVVLYSDVSTVKTEEDAGPVSIEEIRSRMQEREADIEGYLNAARKNGSIRVRIQVPPDIVSHWATEPKTRDVLREFVKRWAGHPATAGFYLFDEPELSDVPASTLAEIAGVVRELAPKSLLSISVASSAIAENKPILRAYADSNPRIFDEVLVNRYPVYRAYSAASLKGGTGMSTKLGLESAKAGRENLMDNEFQNLRDYYDSLVASTRFPGLAGRPVYASLQAYGLRDDCDGPECKATRERKARRSPTWNELLYMYGSVWMSGVEGAVLYSRYFSLYDGALRKRLDNLEGLMGPVFGVLPGCHSDVTVRSTTSSSKASQRGQASVVARLASAPGSKAPGYLVVLHRSANQESVRVQLDDAPGVKTAEELRFDAQGKTLEPARQTLEDGKGAGGRALQLQLDGVGVRLFRLTYD